jgi:predicted SnoaL-like aldol condensation-catalyzing enzyme
MSKKVENASNLYLEGIRDGHYVEAVNKYTGDRYTQHSTGVRDGKEGFIEFFGPFVERNPSRDIQIVRKLVDGKNVFLQAYQDINNGEAKWVTTDFFDTDGEDKIIEHWDVIAEYCEKTVSGHTSVDGPREVKDLDKTEENKELVRNLLKDAFMSDGNPGNLEKYISRVEFVQHNTILEDGFDAFAGIVQDPDKKLKYKEIFLMVGQGNFVATLSRATWAGGDSVQELCQVDLFRIEKGLVVEHWDNSEPVPDDHVNSGKF